MRKLLLTIFVMLLFASAYGAIGENPDVTLIVNDPDELYSYGDYLIGKKDNGLIAYRYNADEQLFHFENIWYKKLNAEKIKIFDSLMVYQANNDQLHFINLAHLPEFEYLGFVDVGYEFGDYFLKDNYLYLSQFYNGIGRYQLNSFSSLSFIDSSMVGVMVTELVESNDTLYALDEYNGLLRYDLTSGGFGQFVDYMYIPHRVKSFIKDDTSFYLNLNDTRIYKSGFKSPGEALVDSVFLSSEIIKIEKVRDQILLYSGREIALVRTSDFNLNTIINIEAYSAAGTNMLLNGQEILLLPANNGGIAGIDVASPNTFKEMLYNGGFADFSVHNNALFVSGENKPVVVYNMNDKLNVYDDYHIYDHLDNSYKMTSNGDTLFIIYPNLHETAIIFASSDPDGYLLENSFSPQDKTHYGINFMPVLTRGENLLLYDLLKGYDVYSISPEGLISYRSEWTTINNKSSFTVLGDMMVVSDGVSDLLFFDIGQDYSLTDYYSLDIGNRIFETIQFENYLYAFSASKLYQIELAPDTPYTVTGEINLPFGIVDSDIENNKLIGVGTDGLVEIDLSGATPELLSWGGQGGNRIELSNGIAIVSNGFDLNLYYLDHVTDVKDEQLPGSLPDRISLSQNYPNPFNLETILSFSLPHAAEVELAVYNILGQKVRRLITAKLPAGYHTISWDGRNESGGVAASGLYFYRLSVGEFSETKKMMLIK